MALISVDELSRRNATAADDLRVVDVRWYNDGNIPGAIFLDLDADLADPAGLGAPGRHPLPAPDAFRRRLEQVGIGSHHLVVAYDDTGGMIAARLWWMLDNLGHRGDVESVDPVAGHIATAKSAPASANLAANGRFLPVDELRRQYADLSEGRPVVAYCGSGATACHNSLAMRLAGLPDPILYAGSYSDWSRSGMPVVTGAEAGSERRNG